LEATDDIKSNRAQIDVGQLKSLYDDVTGRLSGIQKSFEALVAFHNRMIEEKVRYVSKELPALKAQIEEHEATLRNLLTDESSLAEKVSKSDSFEELEAMIIVLNDKYRRKGEYEKVIQQITDTDAQLRSLNADLTKIDDDLFSSDFKVKIQAQLDKLNRYFSEISEELYGEQYALKCDIVTNKLGQRLYKFSSFNTNFSSGKKQGEITCFDIAYTLFADKEGIPCYHFLLNDKKELMHDNQLSKIASLVNHESEHVQFVASILKDKLPADLNKDEYFVVKLSQADKLFRIEADT
jgi:uncharacterized protein YydD (DUF2326 family)